LRGHRIEIDRISRNFERIIRPPRENIDRSSNGGDSIPSEIVPAQEISGNAGGNFFRGGDGEQGRAFFEKFPFLLLADDIAGTAEPFPELFG
jgi:hypothetical protein